MKKRTKRTLSGLLCVSMAAALLPTATSFASADSVQIESVVYRDPQGNEIENIVGAESFGADITFEPVGADTDAAVYMAFYSEDKRLVGTQVKNVELKANTLKQSVDFEISGLDGAVYADVLVWNGDQKPLAEKYDSSLIQNVRIDGNPAVYDTLEGKLDYLGDRSGFTYTWLVSDSKNGAYSELEDNCNEEDDKLSLFQGTDYEKRDYEVCNESESDVETVSPYIAAGMSPGLQGKFVKFRITDAGGQNYESEPVQIKKSYGDYELLNGTAIDGAMDSSNPDYIFTVGGQDFVLLDAFDNDVDGRYLVIACDTYGGRQYYMTDQSQRPFEMANWLNTTFKNNGNKGYKLPDEILENIDYDRYWSVEQGAWWHVEGTFGNNDGKSYRHVAVRGGIMVPAYNELEAYKDKIGLHDTNSNWWLRSPCAKNADSSQADGNWMMRITDSGNQLAGCHGRSGGEHNIKPIFVLSSDFFAKVKPEAAGKKVYEQIAKDVSYQDLLSAGYTETEIKNNILGIEDITNVYMDGIFEYYQTVTGVVETAQGVDTSALTGTWLVSDSENGSYTEIPKDGQYVTDTQITLVQGAEITENPDIPGSMLLLGDAFTYPGKWLKYRAEINGAVKESEARQIGDKWGIETLYARMEADGTYKADTPADYKFTVDGQEFILLDTTESSKSHYYILADQVYTSTHQGSSQHMEAMCNWLNGDFKNGGYLPEQILSRIDYDRYWKVAPRYWERPNEQRWQPAVKGGIGLLGRQEYIGYHDKIGYAAGADWWLYDPATAHGMEDGNYQLYVEQGSGNINTVNMTTTDKGIRPAFYLGEDFFKEVKISGAGSAVLAQVLSDCTEEELISLYGINYKDLITGDPDAEKYINVYMDGIFEYYQTVKGVVSTNETISDFSGRWLVADSENGEYSQIPQDGTYVTQNSITLVQGSDSVSENEMLPGSLSLKGINQTYAGKWIKYEVVVNGEVYTSEARQINEPWGNDTEYTALDVEGTYAADTPAEYKFTIDGQEFILLDTTESSSSHYYILADGIYTNAKKGSSQRVEEMTAWLNGDFRTAGYLPEQVLDRIDYEHYWKVAPRYWERNITGLWHPAVKGGIGLLSRREYIAYHEKLGYAAGGNWWLYDPATALGQANGEYVLYVNADNGNIDVMDITSTELGIRPAFYVDEDFFANVKISGAGSEVMERVLEDYSDAELIALYGADYLSQMSSDSYEQPIQPVMQGIFEYYNTVYGSAVDNNPNDGYDLAAAEFSWQYADAENGLYTDIPADGEYVTDTSIRFVQGMDIRVNDLDPDRELLYENTALYAGKWIRYCAEINGQKFYSESKKIGDGWGGEALYQKNTVDSTYVQDTPEENVFIVGGQEFILLDTADSDEAHYFVLAKDQYLSTRKGEAQRFEYMMSYLNNEFISEGYLPQEIVDNAAEFYWKVGPRYWGRSNDGLWMPAVWGKISLLSNREYLEYHEKIGTSDGNAGNWWLRDPAIGFTSDGNHMMVVDSATGATSSLNMTTQDAWVRPAFYLNKDFFKNVKISNAGQNVLDRVIADVSEADLIALYGEDYMGAMGESTSDIELRGIFETSEELVCASDKVDLSGASYKWYASTKKMSAYQEVGDNTDRFTVDDSLAGYYIKASATVGDAVYETVPERIGSLWTVRQSNQTLSGVSKISPAEYVFSVDGRQYILLDETTSDRSKYLIMTKHNVENRKYTENGYESQIMSKDANTLGYWLNSTFMQSLPTQMQAAVNVAKNWKIDIPMWAAETELELTAGIVVPAVNDIIKYKDRIGFDEDMGDSWWTRSPLGVRGGDGNHVMDVNYVDGNAELISKHSTAYSGVRAMFYVNKNFFDTVKLDSAGSEVLKCIQNNGLYSESEWEALNNQSKEGVTFNIPTEINANENTGVSVDLDIDRKTPAEYTIEYSCNGDESEPLVKELNGVVNETETLSVGAIPNGINNIKVSVKRDGILIAEHEKEVTVYSKYQGNVNDSSTLSGYCAYMGGTGSDLLDKAVASGSTVNRIALTWEQIEDGLDGRGKGEYDWEEMDAVMIPLFESGIEPVVLLCYGNSLYAGTSHDYNGTPVTGLYDKEAVDAFAAYAKAVAQHYLDMGYEIKYFEFWNEPNAGNFFPPSLGHNFFSDAMAVTANEIKKVLPNAAMISGALSHADPAWMKYMVNTGYYAADGFSYHPYVSHYTYKNYIDESDLYNIINDMNKVQLSYGGWKENWITEFGITTWNHAQYGFNEDEQASELVKEAIISQSAYTDANIYYCFRNTGNNESEYEDNFGTLEANGNIKPAYISAQSMRQNLAGAVYLGKIDSAVLGGGVNMYVYGKEGEIIGVLWNTDEGSAAVGFAGESISAYDIYNNKIGDNLSEISVGSDPIYLHGLKASWANIALADAIESRINSNCADIGVDTSRFASVLSIASELSQKADIVNADAYIQTNYALADSIISDLSISEKQRSSLLYTVHQLGVMLAGYGMLTESDATELTASERYDEVSASVQARENSIPGGKLIYSDAMLSIAYKYIDFLKEAQESPYASDYKDSVLKAYDTIANNALDIAQKFSATETLTSKNLLIQVPVNAANLEMLTSSFSRAGTLAVSVYNYSSSDLDNVTMELLLNDGTLLSSEAVSFSCPAGGSTQVSVPYKAVQVSRLITSSNGKNYYTEAVIKSGDSEIATAIVPLNVHANNGLFME